MRAFGRLIYAAIFVSLPALADAPVTAADPSTLLASRAAARAGATVASYLTHDALFQNPASPAFLSRYAVNLAYVGAGDAVTASIVDTKSGPVGGGIYYMRRDLSHPDLSNSGAGLLPRIEDRAGVSLMGKLAPELAVGSNVRYAYQRSLDASVPSTKNWNFDLGLQYKVNTQITIGAVGQNLLEDTSGMNPKLLVFGAEFRPMPSLVLSAQATKVLQVASPLVTFPDLERPLGFSLGGEYEILNGLNARAGFSDSRTWKQKLVALGGGYEAKSFSVDYSFQTAVDGSKLQVHSVTVSGYF